jgi:alpha-tubulin suppressor-like RCC1 family protein
MSTFVNYSYRNFIKYYKSDIYIMKKHFYVSVILLIGSIMSVFSISNTISGGDAHGVIICAKGEVWAWGNNSGNRLGLDPNPGTSVSSPRRVKIPEGLTFSQVISFGGGHIIALSCKKTVYVWGNNELSVCGVSTPTVVTSPNPILKGATPGYDLEGNPGGNYLGDVKYVASTCAGALAILNTGELVGWGGNYGKGGVSGQWLPGTTATPVYINYATTINGGARMTNVIHVDGGDNNVAILVEEPVGSGLGTVYTLGSNNGHNGGDNTTRALPVLRADNNQPLTNVRMVNCMTIGGFAMDVDGYVWAWGGGESCATGTGNPDADRYATKVLAGAYSAISGESFLTDVKDIAGGRAHGIAVTKEGYLLTWGNSLTSNCTAQFLNYCDGTRVSDAVHVASGDNHSYMVNDKNEYYAIGANGSGQLGIGTTANSACLVKMNVPCLPIDPCPEVFMPQQVDKCPDKPVDLFTGFVTPAGIERRYYFKWSYEGVPLNTATLEQTQTYCWEFENPQFEDCGCDAVCDEGDDPCFDACLEACDPKPLPPPEPLNDPYNKTRISVTKPGLYTVEAYYVGENIPCDACQPAFGTVRVVDMNMTVDVLPVTSCVADPVNPGASDNVCFKFTSKYTDIDSKFELYTSETGGGAPLETFNFLVAGPKTDEFCVKGDKVGTVKNPPVDTTYTIWLEDKTVRQGTFMNNFGCTAGTGVGPTGQNYTLQIKVYENIILNAVSVYVTTAGGTITPVIYAESATKCNTHACPNTSKEICRGNAITTAAGELVLTFNNCELEGLPVRGISYFVGIQRSAAAMVRNHTGCNVTGFKDNLDPNAISALGTYANNGYSASQTPFYNFKFNKLSSYTCGRMKLTSKYYCPPCVIPELQGGKRVDITTGSDPKSGNSVFLCQSKAVTLTVRPLVPADATEDKFDIQWYADSQTGALLGEVFSATTATYTVPAFTLSNPNVAETKRIYVKVRDNKKPLSQECWEWDYVDIVLNPVPAVNPLGNQTVCNGEETTAVNFTGNIAGITYNWTNSNTDIGLGMTVGSGNIVAFTATNETDAPISSTITVTPTANNCTGSPVSFTITVDPTPTVNKPADQAVCNGKETTAVNFTGNMSATYNWTNSNTAINLAGNGIGNITAFTATNTTTAAISGTIQVTPKANDCAGTPVTFTITVKPVPTVTQPADQDVCNGKQTTAVNFTGNLGSGATYDWTNSNLAIGLTTGIGSGNIAAFTATNTTTEEISSTIQVTPTANGCTGLPVSFTITVAPVPVPPTITHHEKCPAKIPTFIAWSSLVNYTGTTLNWYEAATDGSPVSDPGTFDATLSQTKSYWVSQTMLNGCESPRREVKVSISAEPANPTITPYNECATVSGTSKTWASLVATTDLLTWYDADNDANITGTPPDFNTGTVMPSTTYYVVVTDSEACKSNRVPVTVQVKARPTAILSGGATICEGQSSSLTVNFTGSLPFKFTYYDGTTTSQEIIAATNPYTITSLTPSSTKNYTLFSLSDLNCTAVASDLSGTATITVDPTPNAVIINNSGGIEELTCDIKSISLTATGGATYSWNNSLGNQATVEVTKAGTYVVTVATLHGCTATASVTITTDPSVPVAHINSSVSPAVLTCTTPAITLTASGGDTFAWNDNWGVNSSITVTTAGTYTVTVTLNGCDDVAHITVASDQSLPVINVNNAGICLGNQATLTASGADTYTWTPSAGLSATTGSSVIASPTVTTIYTVEGVIRETGCKNTANDTVYVEIPIELTLKAPESVELGNELTINVIADRTDHGNFEWFVNNQPYKTTGEYSITLAPGAGKQHFLVTTATTKLHCPSSSEVYVRVTEFIPNIIHPYNPTGINCCFMKSNEIREGYHVEIYNRYMQKVFEGDDGWDGTYQGALSDPGTYFYRLHKKDGQIVKGTLEVAKF